MRNLPCVLSIAGTDPTGGAGLQADIKTISATGAYAASVITALVAQNTQGVQAIQNISPNFIDQQLHSVFNDLDIRAIKIGMLHSLDVIKMIESHLKKIKKTNATLIIIDPVMVATSGCALIAMDTLEYLKQNLFPLANLLTPNLFEAEKILNQTIQTSSQMEAASKTMGELFKTHILIKGGHLQSELSCDVLYDKKENNHYWFKAKRIHTNNTHGTGCTLSSAIASYLAQSYSLYDAIKAAKKYLTCAIEAGSELKLGKGNGPVDHFYFLQKGL